MINDVTSEQTLDSILRFLQKTGILRRKRVRAGYESVVLQEEQMVHVSARRAGMFYRLLGAGAHVHEGDLLARILNPLDCSWLEDVTAPCEGTVFFAHNRPLALEHALIYRIVAH